MKLVVYTPDIQVFNTYYYGYGKVLSHTNVEEFGNSMVCTVVDYGEDTYRAEYQQGRFWSGLYRAELI